jgi:hypothetical protein
MDIKNNNGKTVFEITIRAGYLDIENLIVLYIGSVDGGEV